MDDNVLRSVAGDLTAYSKGNLSFEDVYSDLQSGKIKIHDYDASNSDFMPSYSVSATDVPTAYKLVDAKIDAPWIGLQSSNAVNQFSGTSNPNISRALQAAAFMQQNWSNGMNSLWEDPSLLGQFGLSPQDAQQLYPAAQRYEEARNANRTASNRETNMNVVKGLAAVAGVGALGGAMGGAAGSAKGAGALAGDWGAAAGPTGMGLAEGSGSALGTGATGYGAGGAVGGGSIWDSIGSQVAKGASTLGKAIGGANAGNVLRGLVSGATNLYGANKTQDLLDEIRKGSDPFAGERSRYFEPTAQSSARLGEAQDLAMRGLSDPEFWDQSWLNDAAERAGADTQKKLASQGYNFSTNTINNMSKNMRDTRANYIIPGQQNLISNVGAQGNATQTLGNLAGSQFNIGQAAPTLLAGQGAVNLGINSAAGNVAAGFNTQPSGGGGFSLGDLFGWNTTKPNNSAWGDGSDPFTLGSW
jgi:hypothetical protein